MFANLCIIALTGFGALTFPPVSDLPETKGLPDPFLSPDHTRITTPAQWPKQRQYLLDLLAYYEYGKMPPSGKVVAEELSEHPGLEGKATVVEFTLKIDEKIPLRMHCGLVLPSPLPAEKVPVIIAVDPVWQPHVVPIARQVIERGYAFAGFIYHDIDNDTGKKDQGVYPSYPEYDWGSVAAWAWGAMRLTDYLVTRPEIDTDRLTITGHSRCGKAALLAGAMDTRFALVAPHCSGAGGAGSFLIQPEDAETLTLITDPKRFYYWFSPRLSEFSGKENRLPFDQHFLKACIAPRYFLSLEAQEDKWANPEGAQQTHRAAEEVYHFLGESEKTAFILRPGGHDPTDEDWKILLDYADSRLLHKPLVSSEYLIPVDSMKKAFTWSAPK